jgi:hypothetical protein
LKNKISWIALRRNRKNLLNKFNQSSFQSLPHLEKEDMEHLMQISYSNKRKTLLQQTLSRNLMILRLTKNRRSPKMMEDLWPM